MPLTTGARLGPYEITAAIGAGGMGEVYRARDTRLERDVAIKIVSELFAADPERLARFEREAKTLASLNHPNIAQIHGIEGADIVRALVMEFVDGEDLAERLTAGPIPVPEAIAIARQIADALDAAHERGVVHRDLKPANIKVRDDGTVKVLDFGLSKAMDPRSSSAVELAQSPTFTSPATQLGVILGTAAYMSPEQARGKAVDKRTDIWAFGVVLFEMLAGRSPFAAETITDVLSKIVSADPDWSRLPADTPQPVRDLLKRCLERDPRRRLRDMGDVRFELERPVPAPAVQQPPAARRSSLLPVAIAAAIALGAGVLAGWLLTRGDAAPPAKMRRFGLSGISLVEDGWQSVAVSRDARHIAYRAFGPDGLDRIYVRALEAIEPRPLAGSEGGRLPFFSADGSQVAFFAAGHLRRSPVGTGSPQAVLPLKGVPFGGTWMDDGSIVFIDSVSGLQRLPSGGTQSETLRGPEQGDIVTPFALPGSRALLLGVRAGTEARVGVFSLADRSLKIIAQDGWAPVWSPATGVIFSQGDTLVRLPFDAERLVVTGAAEPLPARLPTRFSVQMRAFGVADDGTIAYIPAPSAGSGLWEMVWVDREGRETTIADVGVTFDAPRLSPDGTRIVFRKPAPNCDLWSFDLERGVMTRLTLEGDNHGSVWMDDRRVAFARTGEPARLLTVDAAGGHVQPLGDPSRLSFLHQRGAFLTSWSRQTGEFLVRSGADTYVVGRSGDAPRLGIGGFEDSHAVFSPDGRYVAYVSDESGRLETYIQPHPPSGPRLQVSMEGGTEPVWSRGGDELFFRQGRRLFAVEVRRDPSVSLGRPKLLFTSHHVTNSSVANYDVSRDGKQFVMIKGPAAQSHDEIVVLFGAFPSR
jgi:hypothetical protein